MTKSTATHARDERFRHAMLLCGTLLLVSCVHQPGAWRPAPALPEQVSAESQEQLAACRTALGAATSGARAGLDATEIRLLNWNVQKKRDLGWRSDFDRLAGNSDLVLMQEASLGGLADSNFANGRHWSFAPGHSTENSITGVLTLSRSEPLARCTFTSIEPWLRTPKATSIAAFALSGRDETLLVVNLHAVNFSFGLSDYKNQFHQVGRLLQGHEGPVILAGDFNTWHKRRMQVVDSLAESLDLQPVTFDDDTRMRFFGSALDHIYVRQLQLVNAETATVYTSDHNPLVAVLSMPFAAP
jgi:endonuclease/exonuclease/phosphatase (EEP) superfamily protein YafD